MRPYGCTWRGNCGDSGEANATTWGFGTPAYSVATDCKLRSVSVLLGAGSGWWGGWITDDPSTYLENDEVVGGKVEGRGKEAVKTEQSIHEA